MREPRRLRQTTQKVRGGDRKCQAVTAQEQPRGAIPSLRSGAADEKSNPMSKEQGLCGRRRAKRSYSTFKVRRGELVQGKKQWLRFAGEAVKRYATSNVRETQIRW